MCGCGWILNHLMGGQQSAYHEVYMALRSCRRMVISQYLVWAAVTRDDTERGNACLVGESQIRHWVLHANMLIYQW